MPLEQRSAIATQPPEEQMSAAPDRDSLDWVLKKIRGNESFETVLPLIEVALLKCLGGERFTIYRRDAQTSGVVSRYASGGLRKQIRLPLSNSSVAGYVALTGDAVCIGNVHDETELAKHHPNLKFNHQFDHELNFTTHSILAVPILNRKVVLGVLQIINKNDGAVFEEQELQVASRVAKALSRRHQHEFNTTDGPYDLLVSEGRVSWERLKKIGDQARTANSNIPRILMQETDVTLQEIGLSLAQFYHVPFLAFDEAHEIPVELLEGINRKFLHREICVPVDKQGDQVVILLSDPLNTELIRHIQSLVQAQSYVIKVGVPDDILRYLGGEDRQGKDESSLVDMLDDLEVFEVEQHDSESSSADDDTYNENQSAIIGLVNKMILEAYNQGASDVHVEPAKGSLPSKVRFRVDGVCKSAIDIPASHIKAVVSRIKVMSGLDISERRLPQDGKCAIRFRNRRIEVRVATLPTVHGESAVLRILSSGVALPLSDLNLSESNKNSVERLVRKSHGVFLVVGPTGSGKTTTLHSVLGHLNQDDRKIWTAEDPVEITQPGLQQVQVQPRIGFDFAAALRAFLRADPDVIMIGEMRDLDTAQIVVEASLTGHLVLSTLHTNSAPETLTRLVDLGLDASGFADSLLGVLAQRLIRTLCISCKAPYEPAPTEIRMLLNSYGREQSNRLWTKGDALTLYKAVGCDECGGAGYRGRTGIHELLVGTPAIRALISRNAPLAELRDQAERDGMHTLLQDGIEKIFIGQTDFSQLRRVVGG